MIDPFGRWANAGCEMETPAGFFCTILGLVGRFFPFFEAGL